MKKAIILLVFILPLLTLRGQDADGGLLQKCCIDSKTGDTVRASFWKQVDFSSKYLLNFRMTRINSIYTLELSYHFGRDEPFAIAKGDSVWIKFIGGFRLSLYANDSVKSRKGGARIPGKIHGSITEGITVKYNVSQQQVLGFSGNKIEKIRIFGSNSYNDINWPEPEPSHEGLNPKPILTIQIAKVLLEKGKQYKICEPEKEPVDNPREDANKDNF
ncbi:MAG: hypothetical protein D4R97_06190 [Bacteroidetes bacterium]|nr:MAG: hypothetical protein D4R97_06190 [Bacteroidota bacterium]